MSKRIIVVGTRRKEIDYQRLARALLALAAELEAKETQGTQAAPTNEAPAAKQDDSEDGS
jgi:hypothetical protein